MGIYRASCMASYRSRLVSLVLFVYYSVVIIMTLHRLSFMYIQMVRLVIYALLGCLTAIVYCRYRDSVLPVHAGVILVYIVALAESAVWLAAYQRINLTGEPYCCPFPSHVTAALVLQVLRQTLSRALLLVIALGYSIARPTLTLGEWAGLVSISLAYCGACKSLILPLFPS